MAMFKFANCNKLPKGKVDGECSWIFYLFSNIADIAIENGTFIWAARFFFSNLDGLHSVNSRSTSQGVPSTSPCYAGQAFLALPSISITWALKKWRSWMLHIGQSQLPSYKWTGSVHIFHVDTPSLRNFKSIDSVWNIIVYSIWSILIHINSPWY